MERVQMTPAAYSTTTSQSKVLVRRLWLSISATVLDKTSIYNTMMEAYDVAHGARLVTIPTYWSPLCWLFTLSSGVTWQVARTFTRRGKSKAGSMEAVAQIVQQSTPGGHKIPELVPDATIF